MESNEKKSKNGVARLREHFYEIKKNIKISPELEEATHQKKPTEKKENELSDDQRKIALPKRDQDLDL